VASGALLLASCVTTTTTAFMPTPGQERLTADDARDRLDGLLRAECPRLLQANRPTQEGLVTVDIDSKGDVARAVITRSVGDAEIDKLFGGVAAQMHFQPPSSADLKGEQTVAGRMKMGYSCSAKAAVATLQLL
jgi:outer membrane biosynthesis protein TonB